MILSLWRDIRENYRAAVQAWVGGDIGLTIFLLKLAIRHTQTLIIYFEKTYEKSKRV